MRHEKLFGIAPDGVSLVELRVGWEMTVGEIRAQ